MNRVDYIDVAKGIGIMLVVWAHILIVGPSHQLIYAFHMPLFFFISGLLFNKSKYDGIGTFIRKRAVRLLIPYFIYSVATWTVWACFRYVRGDEVDSYWMPLLQTFIAQGSGAFIVHNSALWFVPCLFAVEIIFYCLCCVGRVTALVSSFVIAGIGCLLAYIYGDSYLMTLPWNLDAAIYALPFYAVAHMIREKVGLVKVQEYIGGHKGMLLVLMLLLFGVMAYMALGYGECSMGSSSYNCQMQVFFIRAFAGCLAFVILSGMICSLWQLDKIIQAFKWCGMNSLDIMCLHIPVKGVVIILVAKVLHTAADISSDALLSSVAFVITMLIVATLILMINKFVKR